MRTTAHCLVLSILIATASCASSGGRSATARSMQADLITREDIGNGTYQNAYDLIAALRPRWLVLRGPNSILSESTRVQVRLDDYKLGGVQTLRSIPVVGINTIRYVDGVTAAARWGADHSDGAIVITTLSRAGPGSG